MKYVAFLRGINVGGHTAKMAELVTIFGSLGLENVKTVIASGNVLFETSDKRDNILTQKIEEQLKKSLGYDVSVMVRSIPEVQILVQSDPFENIPVTPQTRLYVTFLSESPQSSLKVPYSAFNGLFQILRVTDTEVCSVITITPTQNTTDLMGDLKKSLGKK